MVDCIIIYIGARRAWLRGKKDDRSRSITRSVPMQILIFRPFRNVMLILSLGQLWCNKTSMFPEWEPLATRFLNVLNAEVHTTHKSNGLVLAGSLLQGCTCQTSLAGVIHEQYRTLLPVMHIYLIPLRSHFIISQLRFFHCGVQIQVQKAFGVLNFGRHGV